VVRDKGGKPPRGPSGTSGSVLLGDLLGVSRSRERDLQSVLFIYPRFLCMFIVFDRILCLCFILL